GPESATVQSIMTPEPRVVQPTEDVVIAALTMGDYGVRRLPVVENGRVIGVISADDIARTLPGEPVIADMARRLAYRAKSSAA
ncbi:MAG: CBS domain-containing protein, partial [Chloroflexi bacterium]|nr:CBS domain-containing protein [Chloroflexota bacterium]